jgi:hypothetical protein
LGETTTTSGDVGLDHPLDLPGVAGHLERHPVLRSQALGELDLLRLRLDSPSGANLPFLPDRHLAELEVDVQPDRSHLLLLPFAWREKRWANDIDAFAL